MVDWGSIGSGVIGVVIVAFIIFMLWLLSKWRESAREASAIKQGGSTFGNILAGYKAARKGRKKEAVREQAVVRTLTTKAPKKSPAGKVTKAMQKSEKAEAKVEQAGEKLDETTTAMTAELEVTTDNILATVNERMNQEALEQRDIATVEALEQQLSSLENFNQMDQKATEYLSNHLKSLVEYLGKQIEHAKTSEGSRKKSVKHVKKSISDMLKIARHAKSELRKLESLERKDKKTFNQEFKALKKAIKDKYSKLNKLKRNKNADPKIIAQLEQEIKLLERNAAELKKLRDQLTKTYEILDNEIKQLKELLNQVLTIEKSQRKYAKTLNDREKEVIKKLKKLEEKQDKLLKSIEKLSSPEEMWKSVLEFSAEMKEYFDFYLEKLKQDIEFEKKLKEIVMQNVIVDRKMKSFSELEKATNDSFKALEDGEPAIFRLISVIYDQDVSGSLNDQAKVIKDACGVLDYENRLQEKLQAIDQEIEQKNLLLIKEIDQLIGKEEKMEEEVEALHKREAEHLGNAMGTLNNKKIAIDSEYMQEAVKFGQKLEERNAQAGAAYKTAMQGSIS